MLNILSLLILIFESFLNADISFAYQSKASANTNIRENKTCTEYLSICETSCKDRGSLYEFQCTGKEYQSSDGQYYCQCGDDLFRQNSKKEQISFKRDSKR